MNNEFHPEKFRCLSKTVAVGMSGLLLNSSWQIAMVLRSSKVFIATIALGAMSACSLPATSTDLPSIPLPKSFPDDLEPVGTVAAESLCWRDFLSPALPIEQLIENAIDHNRDLAIASARIDEARAILRRQRADSRPNVNTSLEASINRTTSGATAGGALLQELFPEVSGEIGLPSSTTFPLYQSSLAVTGFEVDLWGRLSNLNAAARSRVLTAEWDRRAVQLALLREIVSLSVRKLEIGEQQRAVQKLLSFENESLNILELREQAGLSSYQEVLDQRERVAEVEVTLSQLSLDNAVLANTLVFITGESELTIPNQSAGSPWANRTKIDAGIPSRLLLSRPDIRAAESSLLAMRADVSAARARLFPSISLTGLFGFASSSLNSLFAGDAMVVNGGGMIDLPIFDRAARKANVDLTKARELQAVAEYQKAVENGFREVKDALAARRWYSTQEVAIARQVAAIDERVGIAKYQEDAGMTNGLATIATQRRLLEAQIRQISNFARLAETDFAVFASLGGGDSQNCTGLSAGE